MSKMIEIKLQPKICPHTERCKRSLQDIPELYEQIKDKTHCSEPNPDRCLVKHAYDREEMRK